MTGLLSSQEMTSVLQFLGDNVCTMKTVSVPEIEDTLFAVFEDADPPCSFSLPSQEKCSNDAASPSDRVSSDMT